MEDSQDSNLKEKHDTEFDAFTDGKTVQRRYRLREPKPVKKEIVEEIPTKVSRKKELKYDSDAQTYECQKCMKNFDTKTGLLNHIRMHDAVKKFTCALCNEEFATNEKLIKHKVVHKDEDRTFFCKNCKLAFTDHCDFLIHDLTHTNKKMYKCVECSLYYKQHYMKLHIETHFDKKLQCNKCNKYFQTPTTFKVHMKTHDKSTHLECVECGKSVIDKKSMDYHMISHTGVKPYQCLYCGVGFATTQQRTVHTRKHTNERPYQCDICDRKFKQTSDLKYHMITHDTEKKFECEECGKKYFHAQGLRYHMKSHTKEDLFDCPQCDVKCPSRQALRTHLVYKHMDSKDFKCDYCNLSYKTITAIRRHYKSKTHQRAVYGKCKDETEE
ncbi:gastrula zinc finger protein XlCGF8.2DB-like [Ostrinia furnacalis]|uniref:gastrula zinc finger protein XlCGF8.2DB-like n=1 Tax=Ostrinia furnacalis TaxID=93504 RepID=UPI00103F65CF|nr:gastrula zinc finger protein XlCGF8.2DB-like [Ostrinia furnacalis]XP_028169332.1 gastrula zinc finger protein XlCGF8.2DB-like [Ostrinia furnacalis]